MNFNKHLHLAGQHAFLSASKYHWVNYDDEKLIVTFDKYMAAQKGTELHEFACRAIDLRVKIQTPKLLKLYVNDAIGFKMTTEQMLYYSDNCFGTADTISFNKNFLRIHDLKTGITPASIKQLEVYTALFCLEYNMKPTEIDIELRLYQSDEILVHHPEPDDIFRIIEKIIAFDKLIEKIKIANGVDKQSVGGDLKKLLSIIQGG
jgi:hypothetical protein